VKKPTEERQGSPLPLRATGVFLGLWMAVFIVLALFGVPQLFAMCAPAVPPPSPSP